MAHSRDVSKVVAAKRRGKHCGGVPVLGYDSSPDKPLLVVNESEAEQVRYIFERFLLFGSAQIYRVLNTVLYLGKVSHKGILYDGEQPALMATCASWCP